MIIESGVIVFVGLLLLFIKLPGAGGGPCRNIPADRTLMCVSGREIGAVRWSLSRSTAPPPALLLRPVNFGRKGMK